MIKKLPPLKCPQCGSDKVASAVSKKGRTINCYGCKRRTRPDGSTSEFTGSNLFYGKGRNPKTDTGDYLE